MSRFQACSTYAVVFGEMSNSSGAMNIVPRMGGNRFARFRQYCLGCHNEKAAKSANVGAMPPRGMQRPAISHFQYGGPQNARAIGGE